MNGFMASLFAFGLLSAGAEPDNHQGFLWQPAYQIDDELRGPARPYVPRPGDVYMATDKSYIIKGGHRLAGSGAPHHSGIVVLWPDGRPAILESGPFNSLRVEILDFLPDLVKHEERNEKVWIRQRRVPLTTEQSEQLTAFALAQDHKRFAAGRMLRQLTPFRARGPMRTYYMGLPNGPRDAYFCSELVLESCVHVGLISKETTRPTCTYPRELFFDQSPNLYVNEHPPLATDWYPPARWTNSE